MEIMWVSSILCFTLWPGGRQLSPHTRTISARLSSHALGPLLLKRDEREWAEKCARGQGSGLWVY